MTFAVVFKRAHNAAPDDVARSYQDDDDEGEEPAERNEGFVEGLGSHNTFKTIQSDSLKTAAYKQEIFFPPMISSGRSSLNLSHVCRSDEIDPRIGLKCAISC